LEENASTAYKVFEISGSVENKHSANVRALLKAQWAWQGKLYGMSCQRKTPKGEQALCERSGIFYRAEISLAYIPICL